MITTLSYHGADPDDAYGRACHELGIMRLMALFLEAALSRPSEGVGASESHAGDDVRSNTFDPPTCWEGRGMTREVLRRKRPERTASNGVTYVDLRSGFGPVCEAVDLRGYADLDPTGDVWPMATR